MVLGRWSLVLFATVLAGCQSIGLSPRANAPVESSTIAGGSDAILRVKPASVEYSGLAPLTTEFRVIGGTPPYGVVQSNPQVADLSTVRRKGQRFSFSLTLIAGGETSVTVTDGSKRSVVVTAGGMPCSIPVTEFLQLYPKPSAKHVAVNVGEIFMADQRGDPVWKFGTDYYVRLVASDGSTVTGGSFKRTHKAAPKGSAPGTPFWRATIPPLKAGLNYGVQFVEYACESPWFTGTFST